MNKIFVFFIVTILLGSSASNLTVKAYSNPNLYVSAENSSFGNHFSGSMVVEIVINDDSIRDTDEGKGEPDVTINGNSIRMVQGSDGNWYAYFANVEKAKQADQVAFTGSLGESLDFGVFCDRSTDASVLGISFSETDGVAIPGDNGIVGATQGTSSFNSCTGSPTSPSPNQNNVVRHSTSPNTNPNIPVGQVGIDVDAWPVIQLYSFSNNVSIIYNRGGGSQTVDLTYSEMPNISLQLDRNGYPQGSEVFVTINDMQLNQDPTSEDSWTFNINSPRATFYQAFTENGAPSGTGGPGLVDLNPYLGSLDFEKNGNLGVNLGSVAELRTNQHQPLGSVTNGITTYTQIITLVESSRNSGIFESSDFADKSTIGTKNNAPRGQSATIDYNSKSSSIVSGTFTATLGIQNDQFNPGQKIPITLIDPDQNINQNADEDLDVFRSSAIIPTLQIGKPVTLQGASDVKIYADSTTPFGSGTTVQSSVPDTNSDLLIIDTKTAPNSTFEKLTINLGITAGTLQNLLLLSSGTNWINYDLRSFMQQLDVSIFSDTSMMLHFGGLPGTSITILDANDISSGQGLVQIDESDISSINGISSSSSVFLEINFDASNDSTNVGTISNEQDSQPIVFDLFSFGERNGKDVNNAIYRAELEETSSNSGTFTGTMEYSIINQINQFDPNFIKTMRPISDDIKFLVSDELTDEEGITLSYSDIAQVGVTIDVSSKSEIKTHSGTVTLESQNYRFGQPVVVILTDQDLNTHHDIIDVYNVVDNPMSAADDTVGDSSGNVLLEIEIKGFRYHRCIINGVETGGLGSTGFSLQETGPDTGVFKGSFKMPSQICNEDGTKLISPAGGSIEVNYFDFRDASGEPREIGLTFVKPTTNDIQNPPKIEETALDVIIQEPQMKDDFNREISRPIVNEKLNFVSEIYNANKQQSQKFSYILQILDGDGRIVDLHWIDGIVEPARKKPLQISWKPTLSGKYDAEIFVWDDIESAIPLSKKIEFNFDVDVK